MLFSGNVKYSMFSLGGLYWVVWYCTIMYAASGVLIESFAKLFAAARFDSAIGQARNVIIIVNIILLPLSHLGEWQKLARYINEWDEFLVTYKYMTGNDLKIKLKAYVYTVLTVIPATSLLATYAEQETMVIRNVLHRILYIMLFSGTSFVSMFWIMSHVVVQRIAVYLKSEILKLGANSKSRSYISAIEVHRLRYLWARATSLLHKSGECLGLSMMIISLTNAAGFVIAAYGVIVGVMEFNQVAIAHHSVNVIAGIAYIFAGTESGYQSTQKMGDEIMAALSAIDLSGINEVTFREINMFLQIMSLNPPIVTCAGVVTISRSFLTSVFSNTVTYLIVLLQFKTSDVEFKCNNETLTSFLQKPAD
uniref:Gustatory receptor n=1 Tax=Lygus hesperus TaxID=30085 RepID=A0A146LX95_LYGHE